MADDIPVSSVPTDECDRQIGQLASGLRIMWEKGLLGSVPGGGTLKRKWCACVESFLQTGEVGKKRELAFEGGEERT